MIVIPRKFRELASLAPHGVNVRTENGRAVFEVTDDGALMVRVVQQADSPAFSVTIPAKAWKAAGKSAVLEHFAVAASKDGQTIVLAATDRSVSTVRPLPAFPNTEIVWQQQQPAGLKILFNGEKFVALLQTLNALALAKDAAKTVCLSFTDPDSPMKVEVVYPVEGYTVEALLAPILQ
jgi:hypothetical protein